ncbi:MAG: nucleoside-diphosphate sugar epimerase/dehydratase [Coxiellaceae bacterium]|nr:nucleoside-diphosphate sugar epimerase/dehydratase [Coxiellaceae bacterium]MDF1865532.1 nucleoside-diphosphate sugar epimerase/dehydratase [Saprospiraceae bacterium]
MISQWNKQILTRLFDSICILLASFLSYWLFKSFSVGHSLADSLVVGNVYFFAALGIQFSINHICNVYRGHWRFSSSPDIFRIIRATILSAALLFFLGYFQIIEAIHWQYTLLYFVFTVMFLSGGRLLYRSYKSRFGEKTPKLNNIIVVGSGVEAENLIRYLVNSKKKYKVIGIVDDSVGEQRRELHGVRVIGYTDKLQDYVKKYKADTVVIASSKPTSKIFNKVVQLCSTVNVNVNVQTVPSIDQMVSGSNKESFLRPLLLEDLLWREPVPYDKEDLIELIQDREILVTGGGGSIGSTLTNIIASLKPKKLIIVDYSEFNLYSIEKNISKKYAGLEIVVYLENISDQAAMRQIFNSHTIDIVFHAAAYKHVPLLENQPICAIKNNIFGTQTVVTLADQYRVSKFILISTDKAVSPCNVMGATKRVSEILCQKFNSQSKTNYMIVRFGNVLGSVGSVAPLFEEQIRNNEPITITHRDTTRYFMTIPEASQLILLAAAYGEGGEVFVLDMGKPVKILDLAKKMITLMGGNAAEFIINEIGLRPGERLHEELFYSAESLMKTMHPKIAKATCKGSISDIDDLISALAGYCRDKDQKRAKQLLLQYFSEKPSTLRKNEETLISL